MKSKRDRRRTRRTPRRLPPAQERFGDRQRTDKRSFDWTRALPIVVLLAGAAVYASSLAGVFVFDDTVHIVQNERIRHLSNLSAVLSGRRPTVDVSLAINYAVGELDPKGYHVVNVAIHALAALVLYGVIYRTLKLETVRRRFGALSPWLPLVVALIWAVHPLQTQSVTYVIQRAESVMGLFYLLTLYCVVRGVQSPRSAMWFVAAVVSCALGMGCKAVMVTAPITVLLFDRVFTGHSFRKLFRRRWALYAGLASTWSILWVTGVAPGVLDPSRAEVTVGFGYGGILPIEYGLTQFGVLVHYLRLSFWPHPLCLDYGWPIARTVSEIALPALVVLALLGGTLWALLKKPWLGFIGAWFFIILAPTSTIIPIKDTLFEHRMYLPLAAVVVLAVVGVHAVLARAIPAPAARRWVAMALVVIATVALGSTTIARNRVYHSAESLWRDVAAVRPDNARAFENLGTVLMVEGRIHEAIPMYQRAVALDPDFVSARNNLANALSQTERFEQAVDHYSEVLRVEPFHPDAHINRAHALDRAGRSEEAIKAYRVAARLDPTKVTREFLARVHANLGGVLGNQNDFDGAIAEYREAIRLRPEYDFAHYWWGVALVQQGQLDEAIERFHRTLEINPEHRGARRALEQVLAQKQQMSPDQQDP